MDTITITITSRHGPRLKSAKYRADTCSHQNSTIRGVSRCCVFFFVGGGGKKGGCKLE